MPAMDPWVRYASPLTRAFGSRLRAHLIDDELAQIGDQAGRHALVLVDDGAQRRTDRRRVLPADAEGAQEVAVVAGDPEGAGQQAHVLLHVLVDVVDRPELL